MSVPDSSSATIWSTRLAQLQQQLPQSLGHWWLISRPSDVHYYTGFGFLVAEEREAYLLVSAQEAILWYASFSPLPTQLPCRAQPMRGLASVMGWLHQQQTAEAQPINLAIDPTNLNVAEFRQCTTDATWHVTDIDRQVIWRQRMIKDAIELAAITTASQITTQVFATVKAGVKVGVTEQAVTAKIDQLIRAAGAEPAFPTIVAFGAHCALPHHQPTTEALTPETVILIDFGAKLDGYCSDFTRTWWFGEHPSAEFQTVADTVQAAYKAGLEVVQTRTVETTAAEIDQAARQIITKAGFGDYFIHTTGHGVGIEIHELPSVSQSSQQLLAANMVITIEPGIYLVDKFGYRFENTVLITDAGPIITTGQINT